MKPISIIIITLNEEERIGNLLNDLSQQSAQNFEVIVVDSDSSDNTRDVAMQFEDKLPKLRVHNMHKKGVSLGRNTGASMAVYERLLFLDADVRLPQDFLAKANEQLARRKLEVAGVYLNASQLPLQYRLGYFFMNFGMFITQFVFPTAVGACIFSSKSVHERLGGFDEQISLCEDCDYVKRASYTWRFRFLWLSFEFDPRRLEQDGFLSTGWTYLKANIYRLFKGEMRNQEIPYDFGHYKKDKKE